MVSRKKSFEFGDEVVLIECDVCGENLILELNYMRVATELEQLLFSELHSFHRPAAVGEAA